MRSPILLLLKMERALYFSDRQELKPDSYTEYERIYFGNEFCDECIPERDQLQAVVEKSKEHKKYFSFVTCYVSEFKIKKYYPLLEWLGRNSPGCEVIINDWGMLKLCLDNNLAPVLGRLLVRQKRDPRIAMWKEFFPEGIRQRLMQAGLNDYFVEFLRSQHIQRVELDNLLQGIDKEELTQGVSYSLYIPYGYITASRLCWFHYSRQDAKNAPRRISPCSGECKGKVIRLKNPQTKEKLLMKGRALFFENTSQDFSAVENTVDRMVVQLHLPC